MRTGAARGHTGHFHEAGFYGSDTEFRALIVPFIEEGLAAGEPVIIGYDARKTDLVRSWIGHPPGLTSISGSELYASPARAIATYRQMFQRHVAAGAEQIRIAGDVPHAGNGGRFDGWDRYESAVNVVWQDFPVWGLCLYDETTTPQAVADVVERAHPRLVSPSGERRVNGRYQDVARFEGLPPAPDPLESTPPAAELTVRSPAEARRILARLGIGRVGDATLRDLLIGASEAVGNALMHGLPPATVRVWTTPGRVVVHVHDNGRGPTGPLAGLVPASCSRRGLGLGLWLLHQLDIDVDLIRGHDGFTVRLRGGA